MTRARIGVLAVAALVSVVTVDAQRGRGGEWVQLGQQTVSDRQDHDTVVITASRGTFRAVRLEVRGHAVDFHRVVLHFANGGDQQVELRETIPAGGQSRAIDIDGKERVIRNIDFWYDAETIRRGKGKAVVRVMGRR